MRKFRFRLTKVLSIRQIREKAAEAELSRARFVLSQQREKLEALHEARKSGVYEFRMLLGECFDASKVTVHQQYLETLSRRCTEQELVVRDAMQDVQLCQQVLLRARQERKALSNLEERQRAEYEVFVLLEQQKELDEIRRVERR